MLERKPLKTQFIVTFVLIIIVSLMATMLTYYAGYNIYRAIEYKKLYPANYFERMIPDIEDYIKKSGSAILNEKMQESLNKVIPSEGILYQIMDKNGHKIYGTDDKSIISSKEELYKRINTTVGIQGGYAKIIPVFDSEDKMLGAVSLYYKLKPYYLSMTDKIWIAPFYIAVIFSPFIYIIFFTMIFARKFARNIGNPVQMLIEASRKVKEKDLDFEIDYRADNELGILCRTFNEMKNELKESLMSQWKIEQARHEMVEALAHDLKTPLSVIQGYVESLLEGNFDDKQKIEKYLNVIKENTYKGTERIKQMLYAAELENTNTGLHISPVDMESFLLQKKESYEIMAKDKQIDFKFNITYSRHGRKSVLIDSEKLERILDNIILNSIRYTPEHGTITTNVYIEDESIRFRVWDTGKGFNSKDLAHLFNKFYRGDESRSSKNGHAGLGLYIVKQIVEMHRGSIRAYNLENAGACIEFDLWQKTSGTPYNSLPGRTKEWR